MSGSQDHSGSTTPQAQRRGAGSQRKGPDAKVVKPKSCMNRGASKISAGSNVKNSVTNSGVTTVKPFLLSREDVAAAFAFFDTSGSGVLTASTLKERLPAFYPDFTSKEYRFLLEDTGNTGFQQFRPINIGAATSLDHAHSHATAPSSLEPGRADDQHSMKNNKLLNKNVVKVAESTKTNRATGNVAAATVAVDSMLANDRAGLDLEQLWDLIDTFQRIYINPGAGHHSKADSPSGVNELIMNADLNMFFDPVQQAFQVYDPQNKGMVNTSVLSNIMARIGFGELTKSELQLLVRTADFDQDGKINIDDFRHLVEHKGSISKN